MKSFSKVFQNYFYWNYLFSSLPKRKSQEIFIVSFKGMLVKRAMNNPESCSITSLGNSKLLFMVDLLILIFSKVGTKFLAIL